MLNQVVLDALRDYVGRELLEGNDADLDPTTRLIELGIIDSLAAVSLIAFVQERFGVEVPLEELTEDNLQTLTSITAMIERLGGVLPVAASV